jgi:hypothetical protein
MDSSHSRFIGRPGGFVSGMPRLRHSLLEESFSAVRGGSRFPPLNALGLRSLNAVEPSFFAGPWADFGRSSRSGFFVLVRLCLPHPVLRHLC